MLYLGSLFSATKTHTLFLTLELSVYLCVWRAFWGSFLGFQSWFQRHFSREDLIDQQAAQSSLLFLIVVS